MNVYVTPSTTPLKVVPLGRDATDVMSAFASAANRSDTLAIAAVMLDGV